MKRQPSPNMFAAVLMSRVLDGKADAIQIVAKEVGEKAFAIVRQKLIRPAQEER